MYPTGRMRNSLASSIWRDMARLQDEMDSLLSRATVTQQEAFPRINVWTGEESLVLTTELPGVELSDVDISVVGDTLTLRGSRAPLQLGEGESYHRRERGYGNFGRVLQLPFRVEAQGATATFKNGILSINLPRAAADRPRKIQVNQA